MEHKQGYKCFEDRAKMLLSRMEIKIVFPAIIAQKKTSLCLNATHSAADLVEHSIIGYQESYPTDSSLESSALALLSHVTRRYVSWTFEFLHSPSYYIFYRPSQEKSATR